MDLSALPDPVRARYDALLAVAGSTVVGLDFDGTLSPIVPDPAQAHIHPDGPDVLVALATQVRAVAIVTGRPARQVVELGRLDEVADRLPEGAVLLVRGQYGHERWDSATREFHSAEVPPGLAALAAELPDLLAAADARDAYVEDKGLALAVHTRRLPDPGEAFARLETPLADAAERHGLALEPGKLVLELRTPGAHKGHALREVVAGTRAGGVLFGGDDLGEPRGVRGGPRHARRGHADAARVLRLRRGAGPGRDRRPRRARAARGAGAAQAARRRRRRALTTG